MKKIALFILGALLSATGFAKEVSQDEASQVALRLMAQKGVSVESVKSVTPVYSGGVKSYYAVNFEPQGWTLVSADDVVSPLIGYSAKGAFAVDQMPSNMSGWLDLRAEEIAECKTLTTARSKDWDKVPVMTMATSKIDPIITVTWNQGSPYNAYCPKNSSGTAYVGCVAVAMAQAMSVAQYPPRPQGAKTNKTAVFGELYCNYDNEPDYNWSNIMSGANSYDDVARLLWHCGMSIDMNYTLSGSGAYTSKVPEALKTYFSYPDAVTYYSRENYSDSDWKAMLLAELEAGRAVIYCGYPASGGSGHCFNLDGYDGSGAYHVNWGWGGAGDSYYTLDQLKSQVVPGGSVMEFTVGHGMVVNVRAPSDKPSDITLSNTTVVEKQPAGTVVGTVTVVNEAKDHTYSFEVRGEKGLFGYVSVPFEVKDGELVTTGSINASDYEDIVTQKSTCKVTIIATDNTNSAKVEKTFSITINSATGIDDVNIDSNSPVEYFNLQGVKVENPSNGIFIKRQGGKASKVIIEN